MKVLKRGVIFAFVLLTLSYAAEKPERKILSREEAEYPQIAAQNNLHGTVRLKIWISPDGTIRRVEYIGGHPLLAESALKAVKKWKYQTSASETTAQVEMKF